MGSIPTWDPDPRERQVSISAAEEWGAWLGAWGAFYSWLHRELGVPVVTRESSEGNRGGKGPGSQFTEGQVGGLWEAEVLKKDFKELPRMGKDHSGPREGFRGSQH